APHSRDELRAVHVRHHHVREDEIGLALDGFVEGIAAVEGHDRAIAFDLEVGLERLGDVELVVDDENRSHGRSPLSNSSRRWSTRAIPLRIASALSKVSAT